MTVRDIVAPVITLSGQRELFVPLGGAYQEPGYTAQDDADVQAAVQQVADALGDTGRILVRESGTEPVVRVMVEAESEEVCRKYVDSDVDVIKEKGYAL